MKEIVCFSLNKKILISILILFIIIPYISSACVSGEEDDGLGTCYPCSYYSKIWDSGTSTCVNCSSGEKYDSGTDSCQVCSYFNMKDYGTGTCETCISNSEVIDSDGTCKASCSLSGYEVDSSDNKCKTCAALGKYLHSDLGTCVSSCSIANYMLNTAGDSCVKCYVEGYINDGGTCSAGPDCSTVGEDPDTADENICKTCVALGKYLHSDLGTCVSSCSITNYMLNTAVNSCVKCYVEGYINDGGTCSVGPDCSTVGEDPDTADENICKTCVALGKYLHSDLGTCVSSCSITDYMLNTAGDSCVKCKKNNKINSIGYVEGYINDGGTCSAGPDCSTVGEDPDTSNENICKTCVALGKVFYDVDGSCLDDCPAHYTSNASGDCVKCFEESLIDDGGICSVGPDCSTVGEDPDSANEMICTICADLTTSLANQDGTCVTACNTDYGEDPTDATRICQLCVDYGYYNQDGVCQVACNADYITTPTGNICVHCKYQDGVCQWKCNSHYIHLEVDWICKICYDVYMFDYNGDCLDACPAGSEPDAVNICADCYYFQGDCLDACPVGPYIANANKVCVTCAQAGKVNQNDVCQDTCDPNYASKNGTCVLCKNAGLVNMNTVCQASCDAGYIDDPDGICVECNYDGATCVLECPAGQNPDTSNGNVCKNCLFFGLFNLNGICVSDCGDGFEPVLGICVTCQTNSKYVAANGDCVNPCPAGYINNYEGICQTCLYQLSVCVLECDSGYSAIGNVCTSCKDQGLYNQSGNCQASCDGGYNADPDNNCVSCYEQGLYSQDGVCVDICNLGYSPNSVNECVTCCEVGLYLYDNKCVDSCPYPYNFDVNCNCICPDGYGPNSSLVCVECINISKKVYQGACVSTCPINTTVNTSNECVECKYTTLGYNQNGKCQVKCNAGYAGDSNKICYTCQQLGKYDQGGQCKTACDSGYIKDDDNVCQPCRYEGYTCQLACNAGHLADDFGSCMSCKAYSDYKGITYVQNGDICTYECPIGQDFDPSDNLCVPCEDLGKYYQYGICVTVCDAEFAPNPDTFVCENCVLMNGVCVYKCDPGYTPDGSGATNETCVLCHIVSKVNQDDVCQDACNPGYQADTADNMICKVCFFYTLYDQSGVCVPDRCQNGYEADANLVCQSCLNLGKVNQGGVCVDNCDTGYIANSEGICKLCYYDGATCVDSCPSGTVPDGSNNCITCAANFQYDMNGECIYECPTNYTPNASSFCVLCFQDSLVNQDGNCVSSCNSGYLPDDSGEKICVLCAVMNKVDQDGVCQDTCNIGTDPDANGFCQSCATQGKVNQDGVCQTSCNTHYTPNSSSACVKCYVKGLVDQNGICKSTCSSGYDPIGTEKICTSCFDQGKYNQSGTCQAACNATNYISNNKNICVLCKIMGLHNLNGSCVTDCGNNHTYDTNLICQTCNAAGLINFGTKCVTACDPGYMVNASNYCVTCQANSYLNDDNNCVLSCPQEEREDLSGYCHPCAYYSEYIENNACVTSCSSNLKTVVNNYCVDCVTAGMYKEGGECVTSCSYGKIADTNNDCVDCVTAGYLVYNGVCTANCPQGYSADGSSVCQTCTTVGLLYDNDGKCVSSCSLAGYEPNLNGNGRCVKCQTNGRLYSAGTCVDNCPNNQTSDSSGNCVDCDKMNLYFYSTSCVDKCPSGYYPVSGTCTLIGTNYIDNGVLVPSCPTYKVPDADRVCQLCKNEGLYVDYNQSQCYTDCPVGYFKDIANYICYDLVNEGLYASNGEVVLICPSNTKADSKNYCQPCTTLGLVDNNGTCEPSCPTNKWLNVSSQTCYDYAADNKYLYNNQIYDECPPGTQTDASNNCQTCASLGLLDELSSGNCVATCPSNQYTDTANSQCIDYQNENKYIDNGVLVDECPSGKKAGNNNICELCATLYFYDQDGECVSSCSANLFQDVVNYKCIDYVASNQYIYNGTLVDACPSGTTSNINHYCITCAKNKQYDYLGACVDPPCPSNTFTDVDNLKCIDYIAEGLFIYAGKLVTQCPGGLKPDSNNVCQLCIQFGLYDNSGNCVAACPDGVYVSNSNVCIDYVANGQYLYNDEIVDECPLSYFPDEKNICQTCSGAGVYQYLLACYDVCPASTYTVESTKTCITCEDNEYFDGSGCVDKCPDQYIYNSNKVCVLCEFKIYNNSCISDCPDYSSYDETTHLCTKCIENDLVYYESKCLSNCPDGLAPAVETAECVETTPCFPSPCLNDGTCSFVKVSKKTLDRNGIVDLSSSAVNKFGNETYLCTCQEDNYGAQCQNDGLISIKNDIDTKLQNIKDNTSSTSSISSGDADTLAGIMSQIGDIEELISDSLVDEIYEFINDKLQGMLDETIAVDDSLDSTLNNLLNLLLTDYSYNSDNEGRQEIDQYRIEKLKKDIFSLADLKNQDNSTDSGNETNYVVTVTNAEPTTSDIITAISSNSTIMNLTECQSILRKNGILAEDADLQVLTITYSPNVSTSSSTGVTSGSSVVYKFISSKTNKEVDTSLCANTKMTVLIPLNKDVLSMDYSILLEYQQYYGANFFDKDDAFFNDQCQGYIDIETNLDTTPTLRRQYYQNISLACETDSTTNTCEAQGVNTLGFVICECDFNVDLEVSSSYTSDALDSSIGSNIIIATCYKQFFKTETYSSNFGFIMSAVLLLGLFTYFIVNSFLHLADFIANNISSLYKNDCAYNADKAGINKINQNHVHENLENIENEDINHDNDLDRRLNLVGMANLDKNGKKGNKNNNLFDEGNINNLFSNSNLNNNNAHFQVDSHNTTELNLNSANSNNNLYSNSRLNSNNIQNMFETNSKNTNSSRRNIDDIFQNKDAQVNDDTSSKNNYNSSRQLNFEDIHNIDSNNIPNKLKDLNSKNSDGSNRNEESGMLGPSKVNSNVNNLNLNTKKKSKKIKPIKSNIIPIKEVKEEEDSDISKIKKITNNLANKLEKLEEKQITNKSIHNNKLNNKKDSSLKINIKNKKEKEEKRVSFNNVSSFPIFSSKPKKAIDDISNDIPKEETSESIDNNDNNSGEVKNEAINVSSNMRRVNDNSSKNSNLSIPNQLNINNKIASTSSINTLKKSYSHTDNEDLNELNEITPKINYKESKNNSIKEESNDYQEFNNPFENKDINTIDSEKADNNIKPITNLFDKQDKTVERAFPSWKKLNVNELFKKDDDVLILNENKESKKLFSAEYPTIKDSNNITQKKYSAAQLWDADVDDLFNDEQNAEFNKEDNVDEINIDEYEEKYKDVDLKYDSKVINNFVFVNEKKKKDDHHLDIQTEDTHKNTWKNTTSQNLDRKDSNTFSENSNHSAPANAIIKPIEVDNTKYSLRDLQLLTIPRKITRDERTNCAYYWEIIKINHVILNLFFFKSLINPLFLRILYSFTCLFLIILFNAMLFADGYVTDRVKYYSTSSSVTYAINVFLKVLISNIAALILRIIIHVITIVPKEYIFTFNKKYLTKKREEIEKGYSDFKSDMRVRIISLYIFCFIIIIFTLYYTTIFCNIYETTASVFFMGSIFGILVDIFLISLLFPFSLTLFRLLSRHDPEGISARLYECLAYFSYV